MNQRQMKIGCVIFCATILSACQQEKDNKDSNEAPQLDSEIRKVSVDATSYTNWAFVNLNSGNTVAENEEWDLALQRTLVRIPETAEMALAAAQADFYLENGDADVNVFTNASGVSEQEHLLATYDAASFIYEVGETEYAIGDDQITWYNYNPMTHAFTANDEKFWILRSSDKSAYAKVQPANIAVDQGDYTFSFNVYAQGAEDAEFSGVATLWEEEIAQGQGEACYDFNTNAKIACTEAGWDLKLIVKANQYQYALALNSGVSGAGEAGVTEAQDIANLGEFLSGIQDVANDDFDLSEHHYRYNIDSQKNTVSENTWYSYNLNGQHGIWPNYRVYSIRNNDKEYLVQIVNYYDAESVSGHVTLHVLNQK